MALPNSSISTIQRISSILFSSVPAAIASEKIKFSITPAMRSLINEDGKPDSPKGKMWVSIGGSLPRSRSGQPGAPTHAEASI
jgi:hypothetical protein